MVTNNSGNNKTGASGTMLQGKGVGTSSDFSTTTYPTTNAINTLLYASSSNVMGALSTANNSILVTDGSGVPSISSTLPSAVQSNITTVGNLGNVNNTTRTTFNAQTSTTKTNVTGDGTSYTVLFDFVNVDQASNYTAGTGTFVNPVAGNYGFKITIALSGLVAASKLLLQITGAPQGTITLYDGIVGTVAISGAFTVSAACDIYTTYTSTSFNVLVAVSGATKAVSVAAPSFFSGFLID